MALMRLLKLREKPRERKVTESLEPVINAVSHGISILKSTELGVGARSQPQTQKLRLSPREAEAGDAAEKEEKAAGKDS